MTALVIYPPDMPERQRAALQAIYDRALAHRNTFAGQDRAKRRAAALKSRQSRSARARATPDSTRAEG